MRGRVIDSRCFEGVYHLHTRGLRCPRGLKVVSSFQTLGTSSSVTQRDNPKDLHRSISAIQKPQILQSLCKFYTDVWQVLRHSNVLWI